MGCTNLAIFHSDILKAGNNSHCYCLGVTCNTLLPVHPAFMLAHHLQFCAVPQRGGSCLLCRLHCILVGLLLSLYTSNSISLILRHTTFQSYRAVGEDEGSSDECVHVLRLSGKDDDD